MRIDESGRVNRVFVWHEHDGELTAWCEALEGEGWEMRVREAMWIHDALAKGMLVPGRRCFEHPHEIPPR